MRVLSLLRSSRLGKPCISSVVRVLTALCCLLCCFALYAQEPAEGEAKPIPSATETQQPAQTTGEATVPDSPDAPLQPRESSISGSITDRSGAFVSGCRILVTFGEHSIERSTTSEADGSFRIHGVPPGAFTLTVMRDGYTTRTLSGTVLPEEAFRFPQVVLGITGSAADVQVYASTHEIAVEQVRLEEKQRVLGIFPNFYISYVAHPVALSKEQKFELAGRSVLDPVNLALTGVVAGIEQAANTFPGYGQGSSGFGKRYGAVFADGAISTAIGGAILPSLLHQDPRYFWKGQGTTMQRARYAMTRIFLCKGDDGRWQFNYSNVFGNLASAGLSNLYYPASDRNGAGLTISNALIGTAGGAIANLYQEFFSRRMTPSAARLPVPATTQ